MEIIQRGNLVIYDQTGKIFKQTGDAQGTIPPHEYPVGIPWIEIPYGTMETKRLIRIDVSNGVDNPIPIFEDIPQEQTEAERIEELENQILLMSEVLV